MSTMIQTDFDQFEAMQAKLEDVEKEKRRAIRHVHDYARQLRRALVSVINDAQSAITRAEEGQSFGGSFGFGPIGHQAPFDVTVASVKLEEAVQRAYSLGATPTEISEAYTAGAKGQR